MYSSESQTLIPDETGEKKPIRLHGPSVDHSWSPTDPYLAVFVPEHNNIPARVSLLSMPNRRVVSQQSLVNVVGVCGPNNNLYSSHVVPHPLARAFWKLSWCKG